MKVWDSGFENPVEGSGFRIWKFGFRDEGQMRAGDVKAVN